jgi:hypothetical protein
MAHTKEQRDRHALCGARRKSGEPCRKFAGEGTNHPGVGRCKYHLGNTKDHQKHAVKTEAQRRLLAIGEPLTVNPIDALLWTVNLSAGHLEFIRRELASYNDAETFEREVLLRVYNDERDRLARTAKLAIDAGVAERAVKLAETYGEMLAQLITGVLDDLSLNGRQRAEVPTVLKRHLLAVDAQAQTRALTPARG